MGRSKPGRSHYLLLLATGLLAALLLLSGEPGISPDSVAYLDTARQLLAGHGPLAADGQLQTHWPPGYPAWLALTAAPVGGSVRVLGAWPNLLLLLIYLLAYSRLPGVRAWTFPLLLLALPATVYGYYWSETLLLPLFLLALLCLLRPERPTRRHLLLAGGLLGLGFLVRYATLGLIGGVALWWVLSGRRRWRSLPYLLLPVGIAAAAWWGVGQYYGTAAVDRTLASHPPTLADLRVGVGAVTDWFGGGYVGLAIGGLTAVLLVGHFRRGGTAVSRLAGCVAGGYLLFLLLSITLFDAATPLSNRILAPLYPLLLYTIGRAVPVPLREGGWRSLAAVLIAGGLVWGGYAPWRAYRTEGVGFEQRRFRTSPTLAFAATLDCDTLYSSTPYLLAYRTDLVVLRRSYPTEDAPFRYPLVQLGAPPVRGIRQLDSLAADRTRALTFCSFADGYVVYQK